MTAAPVPDPGPPEAGIFSTTNRQRAAIEARGASIVMRPDRLGGGPHVAGTVVPTEDIVVTYQACQSLTATAEHHRITVAQVWVALWFEAGCDSRRRYHL